MASAGNCGQLGRHDNSEGAVTLSLATDHASLPIAHRLYLPRPWADNPARRGAAGVPNDVTLQTKPQTDYSNIRPDRIGSFGFSCFYRPSFEHYFRASWLGSSLAQITAWVAAGVPQAPVLADAGYGIDTAFRDGITALGLANVVGIQSHTNLWPPGMEPLPTRTLERAGSLSIHDPA